MFANLIESQSHGKEFKRRGRFVIATAAAYGLLILAAGIISIFAYDARVEAQTDDLEVINWVPPVNHVAETPTPRDRQLIRRSVPSSAPVDPHITIPERRDNVASVADPRKTPTTIGVTGESLPRPTDIVRFTGRDVNPTGSSIGAQDTCITCNGTGQTVRVIETAPPPTPAPVKQIQRVTSQMLISKVISLPQPPYPQMAKQIGIHGAVPVQILIDEGGKVISAQAVSGHPMLTMAAKDAAMRARFTPTILNGQPVKVEGVITYNFVLQ